ncbi:thioredoxin [Stratiformator vulcanicus]|uniref:Thioredoxin n=1 Tax=Stratiformator vulcanicus TaxID=2527980 RepID=A0A517QY19_9PLAN|nr:thioredoxin [Stratiformator vulcanicus]QDT36497.1 Thioredoxin-1 [Stratiformator vulcanicus]
MAENVMEFTDSNFESDVLSAGEPVLVDFWAPWCGPCRMLAPTVEQIADEYSGRVRVGKVNTDENPAVASKHNISSIPTVMLFKGGEVVETSIGVAPKEKLSTMIDNHLS